MRGKTRIVQQTITDLDDLGPDLVGSMYKSLEKLVDLDIKTKRDYQVNDSILSTDVNDIIENEDIDIVVEAIGGINPAKAFIERALKNRKSVVTPNKEVIAKHGRELMKIAEENRVDLFFEAAVGGGIPIIRPLKMGIGANNVKEILCCNSIFTRS